MPNRQTFRQQSLPLPLDPELLKRVVAHLRLAPQQVRIVQHILRGHRDKQIAQLMDLRLPTVRTYLQRIFQRVGVNDRIELVLRILWR